MSAPMTDERLDELTGGDCKHVFRDTKSCVRCSASVDAIELGDEVRRLKWERHRNQTMSDNEIFRASKQEIINEILRMRAAIEAGPLESAAEVLRLKAAREKDREALRRADVWLNDFTAADDARDVKRMLRGRLEADE